MYSGYKKIFWGLFFSTFHINLGPFQILPAFVGWLIVADGILLLYKMSYKTSLKKSYNYTIAVAGVSFMGFIITLTGAKFDLQNFSAIVIAVLELPFVYYLMEGSIDIFRASNAEEVANYEYELRLYIIIFIVNTVIGCIGLTISNMTLQIIYFVMAIIQLLWLMRIASSLKSMQPPPEEENQESGGGFDISG